MRFFASSRFFVLSFIAFQADSHSYTFHPSCFSAGLGPVVCSFISQRAGWRWSLRVQAIFAASIFLAFIFFVPETNKVIIERRALKLKVHKKREAKIFMERAINIWKQLGDPVVAVICFYLAVLYGVSNESL